MIESVEASASLAISHAAFDSKTCSVEIGVTIPGISIIKICAVSMGQLPYLSTDGYSSTVSSMAVVIRAVSTVSWSRSVLVHMWIRILAT